MKRATELATLLLLAMYITLFIFCDTDIYSKLRPPLAAIDTILFIISTIGIIYYKRQWKLESTVTYSTIISLNLLTELDSRIPIDNYFDLYENIIISHFIIMIVFFLSNRKNNDSSNSAVVV